MGKYVVEEKKDGEWKQVGKPMGKKTTKVARALLRRTTKSYKKKNRIRRV